MSTCFSGLQWGLLHLSSEMLLKSKQWGSHWVQQLTFYLGQLHSWVWVPALSQFQLPPEAHLWGHAHGRPSGVPSSRLHAAQLSFNSSGHLGSEPKYISYISLFLSPINKVCFFSSNCMFARPGLPHTSFHQNSIWNCRSGHEHLDACY